MCCQLNQARILLSSKLLLKKSNHNTINADFRHLLEISSQKKSIEPININLSDFRVLFGLIFQILLTSHLSTSPIEIVVGYQTTTTYILCRFVCKRVQYRLSLPHSPSLVCAPQSSALPSEHLLEVFIILIITRESPNRVLVFRYRVA